MVIEIKKVALKKNKSILQFDKNNNFIKRFESITDAEKEIKGSRANIIACLKNRIPTAYGFIWKYADEELRK